MTFTERIVAYEEARDSLSAMIGTLESIRDVLSGYNSILTAGNLDALNSMGVSLTVEGINLTVESWTEERIAEAYEAVMAIINRIATDSEMDTLFALMLFMEVFGDTEVRLFEGNFGDESYASTSADGRLIYLYTQPTRFLGDDLARCGELFSIEDPNYSNCAGRDFVVHTSENIIHEFGHVLLNRYSETELFNAWDQAIRRFISPFDTSDGWTDGQFGFLQNRSVQRDVNEGRMTQTELENERIANMFEAWVSGVEPQIDATDERQARRAWAMWTYMTGECPPPEFNIECSSGFANWIAQFGGLQ